MRFQEGNEMNRLRKLLNNHHEQMTHQELRDGVIDYIQWTLDNPIELEVLLHRPSKVEHQDENGNVIKIEHLPYTRAIEYKPRPLLMCGLAVHLGYSEQGLWKYRKYDDEYNNILTNAKSLFKRQKLDGAFNKIFDPRMVALELGMQHKVEVTKKEAHEYNDEERQARIKQLMQKANQQGLTVVTDDDIDEAV